MARRNRVQNQRRASPFLGGEELEAGRRCLCVREKGGLRHRAQRESALAYHESAAYAHAARVGAMPARWRALVLSGAARCRCSVRK